MAEKEQPVVQYVMVVGFHHKKGCQLEYAYPPFSEDHLAQADGSAQAGKPDEGPELQLPEIWKNLSSLGLPDGAHRYQSDTTYFHLPSLNNPSRTVFGVSCYRQIDADKLLVKDSDVTRETVQKAVCVISRLPLYGIIEAKLALITHAYFEERDFSKVQLLEDTYNQLNESMSEKLLDESQIFVGLSVRDLVMRFKHRVLILFKLLLLEKKVLVFSSPVKLLSSSILTLISLFPEMIEHGLSQCACHRNREISDPSQGPTSPIPDDNPRLSFVSEMDMLEEINSALKMTDDKDNVPDFHNAHLTMTGEEEEGPNRSGILRPPGEPGLVASSSEEQLQRQSRMFPVKPSLDKKDDYGFPLEVFTKGYICHPYLSLAYYDEIINDPSIPGYIVGATNMLFLHHHKKFADALVDAGEACFLLEAFLRLFRFLIDFYFGILLQEHDAVEGKVDVYDAELKRQLILTTEDLRFVDYVVRMVSDDPSKTDVFHGTGWEGGEEWVRSQFRTYLMAMLGTASRCSALDKSQKLTLDAYNYSFISAWRKTKNFRIWNENPPSRLDEFATGHPCSGEYSVNDIKTRVNSMITPERAKMITAGMEALNQKGKVVAQTTKSWGGAVSSWVAGLRKEN